MRIKQQGIAVFALLLSLIFLSGFRLKYKHPGKKITVAQVAEPGVFTATDIILLKEVFRLQQSLGSRVFEGWLPMSFDQTPIIYKTAKFDYLFNHESPPEGFKKEFIRLLNRSVYIKPNTTPPDINIMATQDINGINTIIITAPSNNQNLGAWVLTVCHELFHVYQGFRKVINPFTDGYENFNDLTFPFPYNDTLVLASLRIESEFIFNIIKKENLTAEDSTVIKKVFNKYQIVENKILDKAPFIKFKQRAEWIEGVAKYAETQLGIFASDSTLYAPTSEFSKLAGKDIFTGLADTHKTQLNPIRFVGEGVKGRMMFYYLGMAKAYLLDRIKPGWKKYFLYHTLDELLIK
ncbi:MAG: hypothetical protein JWN76_584 [Chitinophagaceae bacterium]|nr:hypothetical protein [Chitinophagaceae bacterium]